LHDRCNASNKAISCKDESRPGKLFLSLGPALSRFFLKYPFAKACSIAAHFRVARDSVKMILARELGLRKFSK
jgi:hypothetical protein